MNNQSGPKPGDWYCENCNYRNFATRRKCQKCNIFRSDNARRVQGAGNTRMGQRRNRSKTPSSQFRTPAPRSGYTGGARPRNARGSRSINDLSSVSSNSNNMNTASRQTFQRRKREHPIGVKALEKMLEQHPEEIVMQLQPASSGFEVMLNNPNDINIHKMCLVMQVLAKAAETRAITESLNILLTKFFEAEFTRFLVQFTLKVTFDKVEPHYLQIYFENLWIILDKFCHAMPNLAMDQVFLLNGSCIMAMNQVSQSQFSELITKYEDTKTFLEMEKQNWQSQCQETSRRHFKRWQDDLQPPENFRELSIEPTSIELNDMDKPFLRRNIIQGKYEDVEHYLDVQFRLLREDFVRPLRNGIQGIKRNEHSHNRDLYVYKNVKIVDADIKHFKLIDVVKLTLPEKLQAENSKRLMFGNLVCLTSDNFDHILFGSVVERSPEMLRNGLLGIKIESEVVKKTHRNFTMVESKSYFTAYKHVLLALQRITENTFPMEDFIVHVDNNMVPPDYVTPQTTYDLRVMLRKDMMKTSEVYSKLFKPRKEPIAPVAQVIPALQNVHVMRELDFWPSCNDLRIDESQRRALKSALTSKLTIIQGPPGTGKTFIGLKIAQVLLHNSEHWKRERKDTPILVVCFTNHALDQFLEGMLPFTKNIVRVGARTKSEIIKDFQISNLVKEIRSRRVTPFAIRENSGEVIRQLKTQESEVRTMRKNVQDLRNPTGILSFDELINHGIIPEKILCQFQRQHSDIVMYLLDPRFINGIESDAFRMSPTMAVGEITTNHRSEVEDVWFDAVDLYGEEEEGRMLDDDIDIEIPGIPASTRRCALRYSVTLWGLESSIRDWNELKESEGADALACEKEIRKRNVSLTLLTHGLKVPFDEKRAKSLEKYSISSLHFYDRWLLYKLWIHKLAEKLVKDLRKVEDRFEQTATVYNEVKDQEYLHVMRHASVVGMTTTGAAQYNCVLQALQPSIVIIEEAAEILEAHVITALTHACKHLIMIGDHQQLQPSATVYELSTKFNLGTSLFERLIKNKVSYESLEYQHRMRPDISRLLVPSIYPNLKDHESVHEYPHIKGMVKDIFFITHTHHEDKGNNDNNTKSNSHEAKMIMALCRHLMLQGYDQEDITVLTPYTGQFFLLKKLQRKYMECIGVRISVVDNFQGEESNIILLSLVRSNEEGKVGFLRTENRICVALSRAKQGLYIMGNMEQLQESSELWSDIQSDLTDMEAIGSSLAIKCENHPDVVSQVSSDKDILLKHPEGGCRKPCSVPLPKCGHRCPKTCHILDSEHVEVRCPLPCPLVTCERKHPCPQKCWEKCNPCIVPVLKTFTCGHTHNVQCHTYYEKHLCSTRVEKVLPDCQHKAHMACHMDPAKFSCPVPCDIRLPCGHMCKRKCHVKYDPDHVEYMCDQPCPRSPEGCSGNHKCKRWCYEDCGLCYIPASKKAPCGHTNKVYCSTQLDEIVCEKKCKRILPCGHHCPKLCKDPCGGCRVKVGKPVPECQHTVQVECSKPAEKSNCNGRCILDLPCGHKCQARCKDPCTTQCTVRVPSNYKCPRGHVIKLPCHLSKTGTDANYSIYCSEPCGAMLDCEHRCKGQCGTCLQGRLHVACKEKCERPLVCGHICKADCSSACPPCQAPCPMKCSHSRCSKKCGDPCNPCQESCQRACQHQKCRNVCGKMCSGKLCELPCTKTLECGHPCVGYCGDPCPPLCRICDKDALTEILFGSEDEEDARFVLLEDCGHVIEATGLQSWMSQSDSEIGMKSCPRCKKPIYNNRRNFGYILETYKNVNEVKRQYFKKDPKQQAAVVKKLLADLAALSGETVKNEAKKVASYLPHFTEKTAAKVFHAVSDNQMVLYKFQVQVLKEVQSIISNNEKYATLLKPALDFVKNRVVGQNVRIAPQMVEEITCEIQRLNVLPMYTNLLERSKLLSNPELKQIVNSLEILLDPTIKFDKEQEAKMKRLLKQSEKFVGGLGVSERERLEVLQAMGLKQGHWYKCPNGHIYCIGECGGAMQESVCPECKAVIGGGNHALRNDNELASEMDGAKQAAWPPRG
ncbi:NFX1-type zinc finger-containing protein 1-like [Palaemon carinicauda]|uniref:NFX1-type zinc finger-containing protein 1-like n=1 Tax=Palaemon carinicauda TaxID=392227 RepID=UPI0035B5C46A